MPSFSETESHQDPTNELLERSWILQLYREFREIIGYYKLPLQVPLIQISQDRLRYGSYDPLIHCVSISSYLIRDHSWDVVLEIFKHELAHALVAMESDEEQAAHGPSFQNACQRVGVAPWARYARIEVDPKSAVQEHRQLSAEQERLLRRVEKLLALAQSQETHEATLAMERARELVTQNQLEQCIDTDTRDYTYLLIEHGKKQVPAHQSAISSILCTHFYVDCVLRTLYDAKRCESYKVLEILGTRENVQMAEYVYWFLWNQLPLLWDRHSLTRAKAGTSSKKAQRSFYLGVLNGFHEKLQQQKPVDSGTGQSWGLTVSEERNRLAVAHRELKGFVRERYPHLQRRSGKGRNLDYDDYKSGRQRGKELNLHRGLERGPAGGGRFLPGS